MSDESDRTFDDDRVTVICIVLIGIASPLWAPNGIGALLEPHRSGTKRLGIFDSLLYRCLIVCTAVSDRAERFDEDRLRAQTEVSAIRGSEGG
ncbi:hypothetical protein XH81_29165 [Bradyrhizobium sp. CCBAU 25360]|nr:hypothetical protein [Bradyrhizobium sp. CCBAU 25360]